MREPAKQSTLTADEETFLASMTALTQTLTLILSDYQALHWRYNEITATLQRIEAKLDAGQATNETIRLDKILDNNGLRGMR